MLYFHRIVPYLNQFSLSKLSKTNRQKIKLKQDSDRASFTLSENIFTLNFCRMVFEYFASKILSKFIKVRYGSGATTSSVEVQYYFYETNVQNTQL